jgi:hypothetical protein
MASIINATTTNGLSTSADNSGELRLQTNSGTTAVTVTTAQLVGVGTTSPSARLHVYGGSNNQFKVESSGAEANFTLAGTSYGQINNSVGDLYITNDVSANMIFRTNNTERMRIDSSGALIMASSAGYLGLATNQTMRIPSTGGISYVGNINSSNVFQIAYNSTSAGVQLSSGATSWGTFSDSRLKNITGTYTNALNDIAQIQPVKFTWKADEDSKPQVGLIAQSIQNVVPEAVDSTTIEMDGTEKYLTVRYTELIPLMIASIQELNAKVEAQAVRIAELEGAK